MGAPFGRSVPGSKIPRSRGRSFRRAASTAAVSLLAAAGCVAAPVSAMAVPEGSGCSVSGSSLGAGTWYGLIKSGSTASSLKVDLVCFFVADVDKAGAEDGVDVYNSYVRNKATTVRTVPVCAGARFALVTKPVPTWAWVSGSTFLQQIAAGTTSSTYPQDTSLAAVIIANGKTCAGMAVETYIP